MMRFASLCFLLLAVQANAAQVGAMKKRKSGANALLENIQEMVSSGQTPAFDKVNEIKRIVNDELITELQSTHQAAVDTVKNNLDSIALCNTQSTARASEIKGSTEVSVQNSRSAHSTCREGEKTKHATRGTRCGELDTFLDTVNDPANLPTGRPRSGMVQYVQTMSNYFCPKGPEVTSLNNACDTAEDERAKHKAECDRKQATFESDFCTWRTELVDNCDSLNKCYQRSDAAYDSHVETTKDLVTKWKLEWGALKKILCYTDVWLKDNDVTTADAGAFDTCNSLDPDTTPMDIDFGTPAGQAACPLSSVANYPGLSGFVTDEYSDVSDFVEAAIPCVSSGGGNVDTLTVQKMSITAPPPTSPPTAPPAPPTTAPPTTAPPTTGTTTLSTTTAAPTTAAPVSGELIVTHGGWEFYKVPTTDTSDDGVFSACTGAGLVTPCAGNDDSNSKCSYFNDDKCTKTSEGGCGNPMWHSAQEKCKHLTGNKYPNDCASFEKTYAYMGKKWSNKMACGTRGRNWCDVGSTSKSGFAFCARSTGSLAQTKAAAAVEADGTVRTVTRHAPDGKRTSEVVEADGTVHPAFFEQKSNGPKCSSLYTADMCLSGKLKANQDDIECGEDPCVDDAADDGLCCEPVPDDGDSLAAMGEKVYDRSELEGMDANDLMGLVESLGSNNEGIKSALASHILKLQASL